MMERRRVQIINKSYLVYLPKAWARENIGKAREVNIEFSGFGDVVVSPIRVSERTGTLRLDAENLGNLLDVTIIGAYIDGVDKIFLKNVGEEHRIVIDKTLEFLHGYEIVDEKDDTIVIEALGEPSSYDILFQRIVKLVNFQFKEVINYVKTGKGLENIERRENEIDKFRLELKRAGTKALQYPAIARKMNVTPLECYYFGEISTNLERIADTLLIICKKKVRIEELEEAYNYFQALVDLLLFNKKKNLDILIKDKSLFDREKEWDFIKLYSLVTARIYMDYLISKNVSYE